MPFSAGRSGLLKKILLSYFMGVFLTIYTYRDEYNCTKKKCFTFKVLFLNSISYVVELNYLKSTE